MNQLPPHERLATNVMMQDDFLDVYIKVHALGPDTLTHTASGQAVDWESERGWFDELLPMHSMIGLRCCLSTQSYGDFYFVPGDGYSRTR